MSSVKLSRYLFSQCLSPKRTMVSVRVAALLLVFALLLGVQMKMMSIVDNHATTFPAPHPHFKTASVKRRAKSSAGRLTHRAHTNHKLHKTKSLQLQSGVDHALTNPHLMSHTNPDQIIQHYQQLASSIADKWNLTTPNAIDLLAQQFHKVNDYDSQNDFIHFHHLYKSGGTSISNLMLKSMKDILPGSHESGDFNHEEALADINRHLEEGIDRNDLPYKASYAHTGLRPVYGPLRTKTGIFFLEQIPHKRLRVITMLRDIVDFRASNHAMIMCGLNYEASRWNNERQDQGLPRVCSPKDGLNISALVDRKIHDLLVRCKEEDAILANGGTPVKKLYPTQRQQCRMEEQGIDTLVHCRSGDHLLASPEYDKHYRSMFKALMGRFHRGQEFTNSTAYGRMAYGFERAEKSRGYSVEKVEEYTLQDLGGLDLTISGDGDGVGTPEPDFIWFGITERMKESTVLFYFQFKLTPLPRTPKARIQECRPISWWTEENKKIVIEREPADYAVWRAANAIMDVRMEKMRMEIQSLLDAGATKESLYYVDWDQLEDIGFELKNQQLTSITN